MLLTTSSFETHPPGIFQGEVIRIEEDKSKNSIGLTDIVKLEEQG